MRSRRNFTASVFLVTVFAPFKYRFTTVLTPFFLPLCRRFRTVHRAMQTERKLYFDAYCTCDAITCVHFSLASSPGSPLHACNYCTSQPLTPFKKLTEEETNLHVTRPRRRNQLKTLLVMNYCRLSCSKFVSFFFTPFGST